MSSTETRSAATGDTTASGVDFKLEVVVIPVADIDRSKEFYAGLGWRLDADFAFDNGFRIVQLTPPGSDTSIQFGTNLTPSAPGSAQNVYLVVSDIEAARDDLLAHGVETVEVFHGSPFVKAAQIDGPDPEHTSYRTYGAFEDPDGNRWLLQQITTRLPGRIDTGITSYTSASDLQAALIRAATAHGEHEKRIGAADADWPVWYAKYMVAEQSGAELPQ